MDSFEAKAELRKLLGAARRQLDEAARRSASASAVERLKASGFLSGAKTVALFAAFRAEIDPRALEADFSVVYPRVEASGAGAVQASEDTSQGAKARLAFVAATHDTLQPGTMGILEPVGDPVELDAIDVFVVPGLAFTAAGDRLGYGGGFYDRILSSARGRSIGFAYDLQILEHVPTEPHDVRLDAVVTDRRFFDTGSS